MKKPFYKCPICENTDFIHIRGEGGICTKCGYIIREVEISYDKPYSKSDEKEVLYTNNVLKSPKRYHEVILQQVYDLIQKYSELLSLPPQDTQIAKRVAKQVITKGRWNREYLALASLYVSNKYNMIRPVTLKDIKNVFPWIDIGKIKKYYKKIAKTAKLTLNYKLDEREVYTRFYDAFGKDEKTVELIRQLSISIRRYGVARHKSPKTVYTAIAYITYKILHDQRKTNGDKRLRVTLKKASKISGLSETAVREAVKEVLKNLIIEVRI